MRARTTALVCTVTALLVVPQCASPPVDAPSSSPSTPAPTQPSATKTTTTTAASTTVPATTPAPQAPPGVFPVTTEELGASWRPGCPVGPDQLRRVELDHLGFDGRDHRGELIVHADLVGEVIELFAALRELQFPIEKMRNVALYPNADDELSMRDDNTSAFNCRGIPGSGSWSWHAYGRAIDVNPLVNPFVTRAGFEPANAEPYLERGRLVPGMLNAGDAAVRTFTERGWAWGGDWTSPIDYQHFERLP